MRVLVVGAEEYAGRHAVAAFRAAGVEDVRTDEASLRGVDVVVNCLVGVGALTRLPRRFKPDEALAELAGRLRLAGAGRLVHLSSSSVLGADTAPGHGSVRILETTRPRPVHAFERHKLREEEWLREEAGTDVVVLRAAPGFGAHDALLRRLLGELEQGRLRLPMGGRADRSFLAGPDLGRALVAAALRGRPGGTYLAAGFDGTWRELLEMAAVLLRAPGRIGSTPYDLAFVAASVRQLATPPGRECWLSPYLVDLLAKPHLVDDGLTRRDLSWSPQVGSFQEGVADLVRWYVSER